MVVAEVQVSQQRVARLQVNAVAEGAGVGLLRRRRWHRRRSGGVCSCDCLYVTMYAEGDHSPQWWGGGKAHRGVLHPPARRMATGITPSAGGHLLHFQHLVAALHDQIDFIITPSSATKFIRPAWDPRRGGGGGGEAAERVGRPRGGGGSGGGGVPRQAGGGDA